MFSLALLLAASAVSPGSVEFDIQCMLALQAAADQTEGSEQAAVLGGTNFFFGRVDSVLSGKVLEDRVLEVSRRIGNSPLQPIVQDCGYFMVERGNTLVKIGRRVEARERAMKVE